MFEVYGEYLFIENLFMNWLILHLTNYFSKMRTARYKIWLGAAAGAIYAFVVFFPNLRFLYSLVMKILVSALMIIIVFTPYKIKDFLKLMSIFYLISFMFGGAAFAIFYFMESSGFISNGIFYIGDFSIKILFYSGIIAYVLIHFCWDYIQTRVSREKIYIPILIGVEKNKSEMNALVDTGNFLQDPLSKYPVIVVEYEAIKELFPQEIQDIFRNQQNVNFHLISKISEVSGWMNRFRLIPFQSLGREHGMLIGFKPDYVRLKEDEGLRDIRDIIVGVYTKKISLTGDYHALLHPDILK